jgi:cytochrome c-type biogenesis protein CcmH
MVMFALLTLPAYAQDAEETALLNRVYDLSRQLYCPVCPNETLDACRTQACAEWREEIRQQMIAGQTDAQIIDNFITRYGERVIGSPQDPALRALSVVTPWALAVVAVIVGGYTLWRWRLRGVNETTVPAPVATVSADDEYRERLERDLRG